MILSQPSELSGLQRDEAWVYRISLVAEDKQIERMRSALSAEELARADRYVFADTRRRFIVCRFALRCILAAVVDGDPTQVELKYGQWGRPELAKTSIAGLCFNVSHSADEALIALALNRVGIDLEVSNPRTNLRAIATQILSTPERELWMQMSAKDQMATILPLWVSKEALLKGLGIGIADGLTRIAFPLPIPRVGRYRPAMIDSTLQEYLEEDGTCGRLHWLAPSSWNLFALDIDPSVTAALAVATNVLTIRTELFSWSTYLG